MPLNMPYFLFVFKGKNTFLLYPKKWKDRNNFIFFNLRVIKSFYF